MASFPKTSPGVEMQDIFQKASLPVSPDLTSLPISPDMTSLPISPVVPRPPTAPRVKAPVVPGVIQNPFVRELPRSEVYASDFQFPSDDCKRIYTGQLSSHIDQKWVRHLTQVSVAAILAAYGMAESDYSAILGAMLVSPIGGDLMGVASTIVARQKLPNLSSADIGGTGTGVLSYAPPVKRFVATVVVAMTIGIIYGAAMPVSDPKTHEFASRSIVPKTKWWTYVVVAVVAAFFFGRAALSEEEGTAIVGLGIATALMPPLVAAGLALGTRLNRWGDDKKLFIEDKNHLKAASKGLTIFSINAIALAVGGGIYLWRKCKT
jgi:uncharacterized membrane protein